MPDLSNELRKFDALRDKNFDKNDRVKIKSSESVAPEFANNDVFDFLNPKVAKCIQDNGIQQLYSHQAEAIKESLAGHDVVLESPTASGKTLSFSLPMLDILSKEKKFSRLDALSNESTCQ